MNFIWHVIYLVTKPIKDVTELINACDAGREGELIFRLIVQYAGSAKAKIDKPVRRLWLQSMTPQAIREGFENLRTDQEMLPLASAARCRSEADWLVGINGTRAMTAFNSRDGGFFLTTVGRVQTPTLSIVVEREEKIRKHVARDYWELRANFDAQAGQYEGKWFDPAWKKNDDLERRAEQLHAVGCGEALGNVDLVPGALAGADAAVPDLGIAGLLRGSAQLAVGEAAHREVPFAQALAAQLNKVLNNSGRADQFRVDPTSDKYIQQVNPASGAVIAEYSVAEFPALARSIGASGLLVDETA